MIGDEGFAQSYGDHWGEFAVDFHDEIYIGSDPSDLSEVVENCEVPLFVLGGPKRETEDEAVGYARRVVEAGASGIVFGRNVWSAGDPTSMVRRLYEAVHGHPRIR